MLSGRLPLLGHVLEFNKNRTDLFQRGYDRHGSIFAIQLLSQPVAVVIGPEYQKQFFTETDKTLDMEKPYRFLQAIFGPVGFLAPHPTYLEQRPILHEPFRHHKMAQYAAVMQRETQKWLDSLGREGEIELVRTIIDLVQQIAGYAILGDEAQEQVGREFWQHYDTISQALDPVLPPHWPLPKFRRRDRAKAAMQAILKPIIDHRRQHPDGYDDFLQDIVNKPYKDGRPVEDDIVMNLLLALMFAGHETTAGQAAWTIIQILQHPDYACLVQAEIQQQFPAGSALGHDVMGSLHHLEWAIRETERTRPSVSLLMRTVEQPIEVGGYHLPAGWLVQVAPGLAHLLPEVFPNPDQYDPLRYAPGRQEDKQHRFALIGFGGGTHKCVGMNFANMEMMIITALLLQQFDVELLTANTAVEHGLGASRPTPTVIRYRRKEVVSAEPV
jgi:sterol 14-demethylase